LAAPPDFDDVVRALADEPALIVSLISQALPDDDYLPWRILRHERPLPTIRLNESTEQTPRQLTPEQWWISLRSGRRFRQKELLGLTMPNGHPFTFVLTDRILRDCDRTAAALKGELGLGDEVTNSASRDRYIIHSLEDEAITSSQLEGAMTTRQVAKRMLRDDRAPRTHSEQMILNNYRAMRHIGQVRSQKLTPQLVCEIHRIVTQNTLEDPDDAGRLQTNTDDRVGIYAVEDDALLHQPPPADQSPQRLDALCAFANGEDEGPYLPGVLRALVVHFMMGYNHFFADGNGRTARALFYWTMLHEGYWLAEYIAISMILNKARVQYAESFLDVETDEGDLTYFFHYHLTVLSRAITNLESYIQRTTKELDAVRRRLDPATGEFNLRQIALLNAGYKDPDTTWTAQSAAAQFAVTINTAHTDLDDLVKRGWLERARQGRKYVWRPTNRITELAPGS
jgi:Fic family protein